MASTHGEDGKGTLKPAGFGNEFVVPGMKTQPVAHEVLTKTRKNLKESGHPVKGFKELARYIRIINRAEKGPLAGQPVMFCYSGEPWPEEADGDDEVTWLQPGTYMDVPKEVALHIVGNVWDESLPDKQIIGHRYGGPEYKAPPNDVVSGRVPQMIIQGPPPIPDLIVTEVNSRGKMDANFKYVYELYTKGLVGTKVETRPEKLEPEFVEAKKLVTA
jgi:hypothetical protein